MSPIFPNSFPGEKLIIKLWDTAFDKGLCALLRPYQIKREGLAKADVARLNALLLTQTEKDCQAIRDGGVKLIKRKSEYELVPEFEKDEPYIDIPNIYMAIEEDLISERLKENINIAKVLVKAEEILSTEDNTSSPDDIDADWLAKWKDAAKNISNEDVQLIWAKILAGEIVNPGYYSLRTIDFIRNISHREAVKIERLMPFVFKEGFIYKGYQTGGDYEINNWLDFTFLNEMEELGLVRGVVGSFTYNFTNLKKGTHALCNDKAVIIISDESDDVTGIPSILVTKLGVELSNIVSASANIDYLNCFAEMIKNRGHSVYFSEYEETEEEGVKCYNSKRV